jgi:hypothetical protein
MREQQAGLSAQFAHMVDVLTSGDRDGDGVADFPAVNDLHLGVVTSDMGVANVDKIPGCTALGQDGILQHAAASTATDCEPSYPTFLSYAADKDDAAKAARDLGCIATVGTEGCGFEQQLEAPLKALWPSQDPMPNPDGTNRITFVGDGQGNGSTLGHGDTDNIGFLRNDEAEGLSLIAIVVVTDEEDCSSSSTKHFTAPWNLGPSDPLMTQPLDLRCYYNEVNNGGDELFKLQRYVTGFQALRAGNEDLVVFGAIAGVPPDLVDRAQFDKVDFADADMRDAFYSAILNDQRMQEVVDPDSMTMPTIGNLLPSCNSDSGKAYPPRRIVQVAQEFGENGMVQSICQKDLRPAIDAIVGVIAKRLRARCE